MAALIAPWNFSRRIATCVQKHHPTCSKNGMGAKPKAQKIEKLQKEMFWFKCLGELIRRVLKLCITSLSSWGPSEHGSACVWSLRWSTPRLICSTALKLPWCTVSTRTYTVKGYCLLGGSSGLAWVQVPVLHVGEHQLDWSHAILVGSQEHEGQF